MKDKRNENFVMIPLTYVESPYSLFADRELSVETLADLIDYADTHDLKWEYADTKYGKLWHVWSNKGFLRGVITGAGIAKVLKKHNLCLAKNLFGNLVLCEVTG